MRSVLLIISIMVSIVLFCPAATDDSQSFIDQILKQRETTVQQAHENYHKAVDPIIEKYQKIRDNAIQKANDKALLRLNLAKKQAEARKDDVAVAKIENTIAQMSKSSSNGGWGTKIKGITKEVVIPASSQGVTLGILKTGQKIAISYIEGKWTVGKKNPDSYPLLSPDEIVEGNNILYRLCLYPPKEKKIIIPSGTKEKPYIYKVQKTGIYKLKIYYSKIQYCAGEVKYKVTLIK